MQFMSRINVKKMQNSNGVICIEDLELYLDEADFLREGILVSWTGVCEQALHDDRGETRRREGSMLIF